MPVDHNSHAHPNTSAARTACRKALTAGGDPAPTKSGIAKRRFKSDIVAPHTEAAKPASMADDDWEHLLRNRATFTSSPWPTDEERAAALADVARRDYEAGRVVPETVVSANDLETPSVVRRARRSDRERKIESAREAGLDLPTFANARRLAADIPPGRYAVRDADGEIKFYKIDKPTEGRWKNYVFLKIMASNVEYPIKQAARQMAVYGAILEAGVKESCALYGRTIGSCGICGRTLTDNESIARGIGPVCADGW